MFSDRSMVDNIRVEKYPQIYMTCTYKHVCAHGWICMYYILGLGSQNELNTQQTYWWQIKMFVNKGIIQYIPNYKYSGYKYLIKYTKHE